jgi:signal transduction histidine kinase
VSRKPACGVTSSNRQPSGIDRGTGRVRWHRALLEPSSRAGAAAVAAGAIGSILAFDWLLLEPEGSFAIHGLSSWFAFAAYAALVAVVVVLVRRARRRALEHEQSLRRLADEHASLGRVATLVAEQAPQTEVFAAVAEEVQQTLDLPLIVMARYEPDDTIAIVGATGEHPFQPGTRWPLDPGVSALVLQTGLPARVDYEDLPGTIAEAARQGGFRTGLGVPIVVDGAIWGAIATVSTAEQPLRDDTEARLADFTELVAIAISNTQARDDLRRLAEEQAALRRVAMLVARGAESRAVFDAVCAEAGQLIGSTSANLSAYTPDGFSDTLASWGLRDTQFPPGTLLPLEGDAIDVLVQRARAPARVDSYEGASGELAEVVRAHGIHSEVGAPVIVDGEVWGGLFAGWDTPDPPPQGAEFRLATFAELIATAVSNATKKSELLASRVRIVAAADEARRRIERNLHDGTQQRLASLGMGLRAAQAKVPAELQHVHADLDRVGESVEAALEEVREISRGLHPAMLSRAGLPVALRGLARRSPIPVELDVEVNGRLAEAIEVTTYYLVSEALANVAKHSAASSVQVRVTASEERLEALVRDDGVGGADPGGGSGLIGLADRVEALGGRLAVTSAPGRGTTIRAELPLTAKNPR